VLGQGIATEVARAVLSWGFEDLGLRRFWASTDARHLRSQRVLDNLGMRREALRRSDHLGRQGEPIDEVVYGRDRPAPPSGEA
jgi:ribosomal-protein-alanine N-acetyltransferase